jgi:hypothetical protein
MSKDLDANLEAALDARCLHVLARMDQMEATLIDEFRKSTARIESMRDPGPQERRPEIDID